tara:strand:+ start:9648 stop:10499 length:852 start_codon:yes stop_codon:yes gene_type:complete
MADTSPNIQASLENAEEIAELTGRSKGDVIADLLDDGKLNNSHAIKENTSALDKATEMAGKTQKLLTALIPILILVAGSGLELGGIINLTPAGADDPFWQDDPNNPNNPDNPDNMIYWGCTDYYAINYDDYANEDDGSCYYEDEVWGCTDYDAINYNENATDEDGSCEYEEPEDNCTGSFYNASVELVTSNNTTDLKIYWDADWSCEVEQYIEVDVVIKWTGNQTYYYNNFAGYNTTGLEMDNKVFTKMNMPNGKYDVCLSFWVDIDGWRMDSEWNETNITIV